MPQPILSALTLSSVLFTGVSIAAPTIVTADLMVPAEWTPRVLVDQGTANIETTVIVEVNPTGPPGPDTLWMTRMSKPTSNGPNTSSDAVANLLLAPAWTPATQGALAHADFTLTARGGFGDLSDRTTGFLRAAVEQGGTVFTVRGTSLQVLNGSVHDLSWSFDADDDWISIDGSLRPDFSATGAPLRVGYRWELATSCTAPRGCLGATTTTLVDRFSATLHAATTPGGNTVPEPALPALVGAALAAAWFSRRSGRAAMKVR